MRSRTPLLVTAATAVLAAVLAGAWWAAARVPPGPGEPGGVPGEAPALEPGDERAPVTALDDGAEPAREVAPEVLDAAEAAAAVPGAAPAAALPPGPRVRARGRIVDAATREPLPLYAFQLVDSGGLRAAITSDEHGAFESAEALLVGALRATFPEAQPRRPTEVELLAAARAEDAGFSEPLALEVAAGPTYRLSLGPAGIPPPETFAARLGGQAGAEGAPRDAFQLNANVRAGEPPWVRFRPMPDASDPGGTLDLFSRDGLWVGRADVVVQPGTVPGLVAITLEQRAAIDTRLVDPAGAPVPDGVVVLRLLRPDGSADERRDRSRPDGTFRAAHLRAGPATLVASAQRFATLEVPLRLAGGETWKDDVVLQPLPSAGDVRGLVLSDSGRYHEHVAVRAVKPDDGSGLPPIEAEVVWREHDGQWVGEFAVERLPAGAWRLAVAERDWFEWEPRATTVEAPLAGLVLRVHDGHPLADLAFDVRRERGGDPLRRFDVRFEVGAERRSLPGRDGVAVAASVPLDLPIRWRVDAPGRVPVFGDGLSFGPAPSQDGRERRVCALEPDRGWGQRYRVVRAGGGAPLEGAEVLLDGRAAGKTGADGYVFVRSGAQPRQVRVRWRDWGPNGQVELDARGGFEVLVRMQPPKPKKK